MKSTHQPTTSHHKLIAIVGPTACGKTELALKLAKKFNGEIISADSRAVYKGLNIGTAKPPGRWHTITDRRGVKKQYFFYQGIAHHLVDFLPPRATFSAAQFAKLGNKIITDIYSRGKLPIICGGTGFWLEALLHPAIVPNIPPNFKLRKRLEKLSAKSLFTRLKKLNPQRAQTIDQHNKRRLIRAIEIAVFWKNKKPSPHSIASVIQNSNSQSKQLDLNQKNNTRYNILYLGLQLPNRKLKKRITARFLKWLKGGLLAETKTLSRQIDKKRLVEIGLAYPIVAEYLNKTLNRDEMIKRAVNAIYHYAKRQKTWFKKNPRIKWLKNAAEANVLTAKFLKTV